MPKKDVDLYQEAIRRTLANRVGDSPNAAAVAHAVVDIWRQMAARLAPVIGVRGANVLFAYALHTTSKAYPWPAISVDEADNSTVLAGIQTRLANSEPGAAAEASHALLVTFVNLLANMIGEPLVERLLGPVWASPPLVSEQERLS